MQLELNIDSLLKIVNMILGIIRRLIDNGFLDGLV